MIVPYLTFSSGVLLLAFLFDPWTLAIFSKCGTLSSSATTILSGLEFLSILRSFWSELSLLTRDIREDFFKQLRMPIGKHSCIQDVLGVSELKAE